MAEEQKQGLGDRVRGFLRRILGGEKPGARIIGPPSSSGAEPRRRFVGSPLIGSFWARMGYGILAEYLQLEQDLLSKYTDYEEMDDSGDIPSSALDIYSDESTIPDYATGRTVRVDAKDEGVRNTLDTMLNERLHIDDDIWAIARTLCKYGNCFVEIAVKESGGVAGIQLLPPPTMRVVADKTGQPIGFLQTQSKHMGKMSPEEFKAALENPQHHLTPGDVVFEPWQVAHFKLGQYRTFSYYGRSILEPVRWVWRRLMLLEDSILIYRLERAPARFAFYVDVGDMPPAEAWAEINRLRNAYRQRKYVTKEGRLDFKFNPLSQMDDFWIPVRHGREGTKIDILQGPAYSYIEDIEYFRDKMLAGLKIPKAYLSYTEDINRATLSSLDVRFARTVMQIQRELRNGIKQICDVHLASFGIIPERVDYDIILTVPSAILELAQLEILKARAEVAERFGDLFPPEWILRNVFNLSEDETEKILKAMGRATEEGEERRGGEPPEMPEAVQRTLPVNSKGQPQIKRALFERAKKNDRDDKEVLRGIKNLIERDRALQKRLKSVEALLRDIRGALGR